MHRSNVRMPLAPWGRLRPGGVGLLALALTLSGGLGSCRRGVPPPAGPTTAATATPASAPAEPRPWETLQSLKSQGLAAIDQRRHGALSGVADAMERLAFEDPGQARQRDALAGQFREAAATMKDALHRFLFTELGPLPAVERKEFLAAGDRDEHDAIQRAAQALAEHFHQARQPHLRATPVLRPGATDPQTRLPVRFAGRAKSAWKQEFDQQFNARMRSLVLGSRPGTQPVPRRSERPPPGAAINLC